MKTSCLAAALAALALAPVALGQATPESLLRPAADFFFQEQPDGSILAADSRGTYSFANWSAYSQSPFFQEHGLRCGTDRLPHPLGLGTTSDCSSSNTNPAAEYDPQGGADYVIPVVFHILRRTNGTTGEVSDTRINEQMDVLNEDFGAFGAGSPGVNTRIQFTLAGVTRHSNDTWYNDGGSYYNSIAWDPTEFLNIYTNTASGNLGYAFVPSGGGVVGNLFDRVVVLWSTVGRPAPYGAPYHLGRSATHEVGHYLGLYHTFQGGCSSPTGCFNNGDLICDTNPEASPNFSPCTRTTCGSLDPTHNYMDYSDDVCMDMFTSNQARRMRCTLENFRVDLAETSLPLPGIASGPNPNNGKPDIALGADLSWIAGSNASSHDVYFGTNPSPGAGQFKGNQAGTSFDPGPMAGGTIYYWRIDEVNATGTTTGSVWNFTTETANPPGQAVVLFPLDLASRVSRAQDLSWTAGSEATSHDVYFGTTNPPPFAVTQTGTTFDTGALAKLQTYYWRIDEVNAQGTTTGVIWSFTTGQNLAEKKL